MWSWILTISSILVIALAVWCVYLAFADKAKRKTISNFSVKNKKIMKVGGKQSKYKQNAIKPKNFIYSLIQRLWNKPIQKTALKKSDIDYSKKFDKYKPDYLLSDDEVERRKKIDSIREQFEEKKEVEKPSERDEEWFWYDAKKVKVLLDRLLKNERLNDQELDYLHKHSAAYKRQMNERNNS
jgi:hypothetical protein